MNISQTIYQKLRWSAFWATYRLPTLQLQELAPNTELVTPEITELLCLPPYFPGTTDHDDASPLFTLIRHLKPAVVLELGTAQGATAANICAMSDARVYTLNALPEQLQGDIITFTLKKNEIGSVYRRHGYEDRVVQIYENTWELDLLKYIPPHSVDLAIIDACHDVDFVINDFHCVLPVLHEHSVVLFHDVHPSMKEHLLDSYVACMCLRRQGFNIQHVDSTWWGIWQANSAKYAPNWFAKTMTRIDQTIVQKRGKSVTADPWALRWLAYKYHH